MMAPRLTRPALLLTLAASSIAAGPQSRPVRAAAIPASLPTHFGVGLQTGTSGMSGWMASSRVPWDYAWSYLPTSWTSWGANGTFPLSYAQTAQRNGYIPVFDYYGVSGGKSTTYPHLNSPGFMASYYTTFRLLMQRLGPGSYGGVRGYGQTVIVHIEPDLAGFVEQSLLSGTCDGYPYCTASDNDPAHFTASVASSGVADVRAYPNTFQGFNWALLHLRDLYAPNVLMAANVSDWATGVDIGADPRASIDANALGGQAGRFIAHTGFAGTPSGTSTYNLFFNDPADHDAGSGQVRWWDRLNVTFPNFQRWETYLHAVSQVTNRAGMVWQVPMGNQYYDTENNTSGHYQDNRVEYISSHLGELVSSGIIAALFGQGAPNTTYYDRQQDGITNPPSSCTSAGLSSGQICNTHTSSYADDDGGYMRLTWGHYYAGGGYPLPR